MPVVPTPQELLFIMRRRAGLTQEEFGKQYGATQHQVTKWELGIIRIPSDILAVLEGSIRPTAAELLTILRRRRKENISDAAAKLGVSRQYLSEIETEKHPKHAKEYLKKYIKAVDI